MCIFPTVEHCCMGVSLRVGMLFIAVLAMITGSLQLAWIQQNSDYVQHAVPTPIRPKTYENDRRVGDVWLVYRAHEAEVGEWLKILDTKTYTFLAILSALSAISISWMVMGFVLLIGTLMGEECIIYVFVVGMSLLVILGLLLAVAASYECLTEGNPLSKPRHYCIFEEDACLVRHMDWLTGSACMGSYFIYMFVWMYFVIVANSFAVNGDTL